MSTLRLFAAVVAAALLVSLAPQPTGGAVLPLFLRMSYTKGTGTVAIHGRPCRARWSRCGTAVRS